MAKIPPEHIDDYGFYPDPDCPRCKGIGWVKVAECICQKCKRKYIAGLEDIVYNTVNETEIIKSGLNREFINDVFKRVEKRYDR